MLPASTESDYNWERITEIYCPEKFRHCLGSITIHHQFFFRRWTLKTAIFATFGPPWYWPWMGLCGILSSIATSALLRLRLSSSRSDQNIERRVVSIWHSRWQYLSRHSHQHPVCPDPPSVCLAMSFLVFQPSSCHLLVSTLWPD